MCVCQHSDLQYYGAAHITLFKNMYVHVRCAGGISWLIRAEAENYNQWTLYRNPNTKRYFKTKKLLLKGFIQFKWMYSLSLFLSSSLSLFWHFFCDQKRSVWVKMEISHSVCLAKDIMLSLSLSNSRSLSGTSEPVIR